MASIQPHPEEPLTILAIPSNCLQRYTQYGQPELIHQTGRCSLGLSRAPFTSGFFEYLEHALDHGSKHWPFHNMQLLRAEIQVLPRAR